MRRKLRLVVAAVCASVTVAALSIAPAHAEPTTGSISGRLTDDGTPLFGFVAVYDLQQQFVASASADFAGTYTVADVPPGDYKLEIFMSFPSGGTLIQWAHQKLTFDDADAFTVTAGATTVVDESPMPTGSIGGTVLGAAGPAAGVEVRVNPLGPGSSFSHDTTDDQGHFELTKLLPGRYWLEFTLDGGARQYHPGQIDPNRATPVSVVVGQRTEITETLLPLGSASGRVTEGGLPVEGAQVIWALPSALQSLFTITDADGRYSIPLAFAGMAYRVFVGLPDGRSQYAHGKLTEQTADLFTVVEGANTVVDEAILPTGQVSVRTADALTGAPLSGFCAEIMGIFRCTEESVASFEKVPVGRHTVTIHPLTGDYLFGATAQVDVTAGASTEVTVRVTPSAIITTTVRDRQTGEPVAGVCLHKIKLRFAAFPDSEGACSDEQGRVRMDSIAAGTYTLFANVRNGVHGMQWVGYSGGTGNQFTARPVTVTAGQTVDLPPVQLDRAGTITGRVTDKASGAPLRHTVVALLSSSPGLGFDGPSASTDADGRYTLTGLGPYEWPLLVKRFGYAHQWSGGAPSRLLARPVTVQPGGSVTHDARLTTGTTLRGTVTRGGVPVDGGGFVLAHDPVTGDIVGVGSMELDGSYTMPMLGPTATRIQVQTGSSPDRWYRDVADFDHATLVWVPSSGTKTLDLPFS